MRRVSPKINPANKLPSQSAAQEETLTFTPEIREKRHAVLGQRSLDRIGNTPLLRLDRLTRELPGVEILGKAEWMNPGGSVKDRAAANIVAEARRSGKFGPGKALLDSTSGNTGIAYAMIGAAQGFQVTLCMPENVSVERKRILHAYGANIIYTDPGEGSDGAIRKVRELAAEHPEKYFSADQYSNDANWRAHYHGTANEIWQQTEIPLFTALKAPKICPAPSCPGFMILRSPTWISASRLKMRTLWPNGWPEKKDCWWGFPQPPRLSAVCKSRKS